MANKFYIYGESSSYLYTDNNYRDSANRTAGGVPNTSASAFAVNTGLFCASLITVKLIDALIANTGNTADYDMEHQSSLATNLGNMLRALTVANANKWTTARTFKVTSSDGSNEGAEVNVDGSGNVTLKLAGTIKAALDGTAANASKINNKTFDMVLNGDTLEITYQ